MEYSGPELHRIHQYQDFAGRYGIGGEAFIRLVELYEIDDLESFLPALPAEAEKEALRTLIGVVGEGAAYMDWVKAGNTFELIQQWQELTGNHEQTALLFTREDTETPE